MTDWATDWDFYGSQYHGDPVTVWQELRDLRPAAHTNRFGGAWALLRYNDVSAVAHDPSVFSSMPPVLHDDYTMNRLEQPPIDLDPPLHSEFRRVLLPGFGPSVMDRLELTTRQVCTELVTGLERRRHVDAAAVYVRHVPVAVIATLLGIPADDAELLRGWVHQIVENTNQMDSQARAIREALTYLRSAIADRRVRPGDDLISRLTSAEIDGEPLPDRSIASTSLVLLMAGIDTVWATLSAAILHLAQTPGDQARLRAQPGILPAAVEEFLRFYAPVTMARTATSDIEVAGTPIKAGEHVLLSFPAANRDPDAFPDPELFIIDRAHNRHLAFGVGIHRCLGSNVARMELRVALETWLQHIPSFTLDADQPIEWTRGGIIRGPRTVPLVLE